jgi:Leucine-rich repeat (LRR) protein
MSNNLDTYHQSLFNVMIDLLDNSIQKDTITDIEDGLKEVKRRYENTELKDDEVTNKIREAEYKLMCMYLERNLIEKANNLCSSFDKSMEDYVKSRVKPNTPNLVEHNNFYSALLKVEISEGRNIDVSSIKFWEGILNVEKPELNYRLPYEWQPASQSLIVKPKHYLGHTITSINCLGFFKYFKIHYDPRSEMNHMNMEDIQKLREYLIRPKVVKEIRLTFEEGIEDIFLDLENVNRFCEFYIKLPSTAKSFGGNLFRCNANIVSLDLSKTKIEIISKEALKDSSIVYFKAPLHLTKIGNHAFANCKNLKKLDFSKTSLRFISRNAFYNSGIKNIRLSNDVSNIDIEAFSECKNLKRLDLSNTKLARLSSGFLANSAVEEIRLPSRVDELEFGVFSDCKKLEEVDLRNTNVRLIGSYAFFNSSIKRVRVPNTLEKIDYEAFAKCSNLTKMDLSQTAINKIGAYAFYESGLKDVKLPNDKVDINEHAVTDCKALQ